jgi:hypothetical protein
MIFNKLDKILIQTSDRVLGVLEWLIPALTLLAYAVLCFIYIAVWE